MPTCRASLLGFGTAYITDANRANCSKRAKEQLNDQSTIYMTKFEEMPAEKKYDLVLFSESFQYIKPAAALAQAERLLNDGGHVLICDFFQRDEAEGKCKIGGGHKLSRFHQALAATPFKVVEDIDITQRVAPTIDVETDIYVKVAGPVYESAMSYLTSHYGILTRLGQWFLRKKIAKITSKYFDGDRNGQHFAYFKTYRLILLRK